MDELGQPGRISTLISYFTFLYFRSNIIITIKIIIRYARILPLLSLFYRNTPNVRPCTQWRNRLSTVTEFN